MLRMRRITSKRDRVSFNDLYKPKGRVTRPTRNIAVRIGLPVAGGSRTTVSVGRRRSSPGTRTVEDLARVKVVSRLRSGVSTDGDS